MSGNVVVASHRRSGTHLAIDTILTNLQVFVGMTNLDAREPTLNADDGRRAAVPKGCVPPHRPIVCKTHSHGDPNRFAAALGPSSGERFIAEFDRAAAVVYVVRDGRDVLVSLYHYMRSYSGIPRDLSFSDFIRQENTFDVGAYAGKLNRVEYWAQHVESWLEHDDQRQLVVRFEQLRASPLALLRPLCEHLGIARSRQTTSIARSRRKLDALPNVVVAGINKLDRWWQVHIKGRHRSSVSYRGGRVGDHLSVFAADDHEFFRQNAERAMHLAGYWNLEGDV